MKSLDENFTAMTITPERELWACAQLLIKQHGRDAVIRCIERVNDLSEQNDQAGAARWTEIMCRAILLLRGPVDTDTWQ